MKNRLIALAFLLCIVGALYAVAQVARQEDGHWGFFLGFAGLVIALLTLHMFTRKS